MFVLALAPRAEERAVKSPRTYTSKGDAGVLVPADPDGGVDLRFVFVDLLARPRNGGILIFEQLLRPHEPIRRKGLHGDIRWPTKREKFARVFFFAVYLPSVRWALLEKARISLYCDPNKK